MPTHRTRPDNEQGPTRLKNLIRAARAQAGELGIPDQRLRPALAPAERLLGDHDFWEHQDRGLGVLAAEGIDIVQRLPESTGELAVVGERFHLKPLLPLLRPTGRFLVLAISQNRVRLLEGTRHTMRELDAAGVPRSLAEALWTDDPEPSLQWHSLRSGRGGEAGDAMFHGQGAGDDDAKTDLLRYFRRVDRALHDYADGQVPLVLACVPYYQPIYASASDYPRLVQQVVAGNPDALPAGELHARAWKLIEPSVRQAEEDAAGRYRQSAGTGLGTSDVREIVAAALTGRVGEMFVASDRHCWGRPGTDGDPPDVHDERRPDDVDLLDVAAVATLQNGGEVFLRPSAEMPGDGPAAALLRY